jgi:di/tricarboxylate transporter
MSDLTITLLILAAAVVLFVWNRLPVGIVALGVALALWATGVLTLDQSLAGFGSPTIAFIAALFVVAEGLDAAGITTWAGQQVIAHAGDSPARLIVLTMVVGALVSALITPNGAAAALIPMVVVLAVRSQQSPSRLLMPLAFSAHAGSLLVLTGTPINVLVYEAAIEAGQPSLRFFEFARVGIPLVIGTILIVVLFGARLLPERTSKTLPRDLSQLPRALARQYISDADLARLRVGPSSSLIGLAGNAVDARPAADVHVIGVHDGQGRPLDTAAVQPGSVLVVRGSRDAIARFAAAHDLAPERTPSEEPGAAGLVSREYGVAEVIVTPRSSYIGDEVTPGMVTDSGELVVLAAQRHGEDLGPGPATLKAGDSLLLQGRWSALDEYTQDPNVLLVDNPDVIRRQTVPLGAKAVPALATLAAMVVLLATGVVPAAVAGLLAAIAMVVLRVVTVEQAHRSLSWTTLILVAGMIPLSTAITDTGAASLLAGAMIGAVGGAGPYALLAGIFLLCAVLGQLISNTATALIVIPIALSVAAETAISPLPLLMCVNVASAAALLTPVATPANMMVMGPGGYQFGDYVKLGLPLMLLYLVVAVVVVPLWWPW